MQFATFCNVYQTMLILTIWQFTTSETTSLAGEKIDFWQNIHLCFRYKYNIFSIFALILVLNFFSPIRKFWTVKKKAIIYHNWLDFKNRALTCTKLFFHRNRCWNWRLFSLSWHFESFLWIEMFEACSHHQGKNPSLFCPHQLQFRILCHKNHLEIAKLKRTKEEHPQIL